MRTHILHALGRRPGIPQIVLALAAIAAALLAPGQSSASGPAQLSLSSPAVGFLGLPLKVNVNIANVHGLTGWTTDLHTDPLKLQYSGLSFQNTFLQSTGRTASCFGPTQFFISSGASTTSDTAPSATTIDVSMVGPFTVGLPAIAESTPVFPADGGGGTLPNGSGGAALVNGGGGTVTYTTTALNDTSKTWLVNQWSTPASSKAARSGASFGLITANSSTGLTVTWSGGTPSVGASYQIVPATTFTSTTLTDPSQTQINVTSITHATSTATVTTAVAHGFATGQAVTIAGANQPEYNGAHTITVTGAAPSSTFTFTVSGTPVSPATGTIKVSAQPIWTANQWNGKVVRSGLNFATISTNTTNALTVDAWSPAMPVLGDPYSIVDAITYTSSLMTDPSKSWSVSPVQIWEGAILSSGISSAVITSHTATALTLDTSAGNWNPVPTKGDAYAIDFGPPLATSETMTVTSKPTGSGLNPGTLGVTRGPQTRGGAPMQGIETSPTSTSITDTTATWAPNEFVGASVTVDATSAVVTSNTKTKLNVASWSGGTPLVSHIYALKKIISTGASLKVVDASRTGMTCGSDWFNPPPTPAGPDGSGLLAIVTYNTAGLTSSTSITWGSTTQVSSATKFTVTSITRSGTTATVTTASAHGYDSGQFVTIAGSTCSPTPCATYNGTFAITVTDATHFTYTVSGVPATPATGTITGSTSGTQAFTTTPRTVQIVPCPILGDTNPKINVKEFSAMLSAWNSTPASGTPPWNPAVDFDNSGKVNVGDFSILLAYWNQTCP